MLLRVPRMLLMVAIMQLIFIRMLILVFSYSYLRALRKVRRSAFTHVTWRGDHKLIFDLRLA